MFWDRHSREILQRRNNVNFGVMGIQHVRRLIRSATHCSCCSGIREGNVEKRVDGGYVVGCEGRSGILRSSGVAQCREGQLGEWRDEELDTVILPKTVRHLLHGPRIRRHGHPVHRNRTWKGHDVHSSHPLLSFCFIFYNKWKKINKWEVTRSRGHWLRRDIDGCQWSEHFSGTRMQKPINGEWQTFFLTSILNLVRKWKSVGLQNHFQLIFNIEQRKNIL